MEKGSTRYQLPALFPRLLLAPRTLSDLGRRDLSTPQAVKPQPENYHGVGSGLSHFSPRQLQRIISQCPPGPRMHTPSPQGPALILQAPRLPLAVVAWLDGAQHHWTQLGVGVPQEQQKQDGTASFPQRPGWALGPGRVQEQTLSGRAVWALSAFRAGHKP